MREQSRSAPIRPADGPNTSEPGMIDPDQFIRDIYVECADSLPGGRKQMGMYAYRVKKAQAGTYNPRPSDFVMLAVLGGNTPRLALAFHALGDAIMAAGADDVGDADDVGGFLARYAQSLRETGEAQAAGAEWIAAPSVVTERRALKEYGEAVAALTVIPRTIARSRLQRAGRNTARGRVEVMQ